MRKRRKISEWWAEEKYLNDEANEKAKKNIWMRAEKKYLNEKAKKNIWFESWEKISEWETEKKYLNEEMRKRMRKREKISEWEAERKYLNEKRTEEKYLEIYSFILVLCMLILDAD
jgi:hypothetical protein